ncbi:MAG: hypothetical protein ABSG67_06270 [Thermoguttaceae bacterium]
MFDLVLLNLDAVEFSQHHCGHADLEHGMTVFNCRQKLCIQCAQTASGFLKNAGIFLGIDASTASCEVLYEEINCPRFESLLFFKNNLKSVVYPTSMGKAILFLATPVVDAERKQL